MAANKKPLLILIMIILFACGSQEEKNDVTEVSELINSADIKENYEPENDDNISIWMYDFMADTIAKLREVDKDTLTYENLINIINLDYQDKVHLEFVNVSNDTVFVKIRDSEFLTQQMGTTGSDEYMISATFTLTELSKNGFVNFDFESGDHAYPGTYSRKYYLDRIRENKKLLNK